ncbi:MAG: hypothetical protein GY801_38840 [bacterium]|nr:hypothetical protein [bacterium]
MQSVVGFYEFYGKQALKGRKYLNLSTIQPRYGFRRRCGIGAKALDRFIALALEQHIPVTLIQQSGAMLQHVAERRVTARYLPLET